jgi:hypothetical protein
MKWSKQILLWVAGGLFAVGLIVAAQKTWIYYGSETSARAVAQRAFLSECERRGVDPVKFTGPQRIKSPNMTYGFVWIDPTNGDQIATMVEYLPFGVESWWFSGKDRKKLEPY